MEGVGKRSDRQGKCTSFPRRGRRHDHGQTPRTPPAGEEGLVAAVKINLPCRRTRQPRSTDFEHLYGTGDPDHGRLEELRDPPALRAADRGYLDCGAPTHLLQAGHMVGDGIRAPFTVTRHAENLSGPRTRHGWWPMATASSSATGNDLRRSSTRCCPQPRSSYQTSRPATFRL